MGLISPRGEYCWCDLKVALKIKWDLLGNADEFLHFGDELLATVLLANVQVLGELFPEDGVSVFSDLGFVIALDFVEAVASEHTRHLLAYFLFVLLQRKRLFQGRDVQFY
jgi:hypothetical protein